ncbi:MAG: hypothetical protein IPJ14_12420 [Kineosporiaceae bacterium]|nr:hypothetical protein [Kineosporiaceae bacterium]
MALGCGQHTAREDLVQECPEILDVSSGWGDQAQNINQEMGISAVDAGTQDVPCGIGGVLPRGNERSAELVGQLDDQSVTQLGVAQGIDPADSLLEFPTVTNAQPWRRDHATRLADVVMTHEAPR